MLYADAWGPDDDAAPILCLPGLTRNARDFHALCGALNETYHGKKRIIALESRGRGRSSWASADTYTPLREINDILEVMAAWRIAKADVVGTSRGGLLAMGLATMASDRLGRVVLNDIGPIIEPQGLERIGEAVGRVMEYASFEALAETLHTSLGQQFPTLTADEWGRLARQLASPVDGGDTVRFDYDPALAERFNDASADSLPDLWPAFDALTEGRPVLTIRGVNSDILSAATLEAMVRRAGVTGLSVPDEGHAPLLWDTRTQNAIAQFLRPH